MALRIREQLDVAQREAVARLTEHVAVHPGRVADGDCAECVHLTADCGIDLRRVR